MASLKNIRLGNDHLTIFGLGLRRKELDNSVNNTIGDRSERFGVGEGWLQLLQMLSECRGEGRVLEDQMNKLHRYD